MALEAGIAAYVAALQNEMTGAPAAVTPDDRRRWFAIRGDRFRLPLPEGLDIVDDFICASGREIPVRRYRPTGAGRPPVVVYFHGGGWVAGSIATHEMLTAVIAVETGAEVVSVHYRRPPENAYPAAFDDCVEAVRWVADFRDVLSVDADRIVVAGDSAGGNLAAAVAIASRDGRAPEIRGQALIYPVLDVDVDRPSYRNACDPFLLRDSMIYYWNAYLQGRLQTNDPFAVPMRVPSFSGLARAYVLAADHDVLLDEAVDYAERLAAAGVATELRIVEGTMHGFLRARAYSEVARTEMTAMCRWVRARLA
ncbi:MAG: alpha/beta hydrolase [Hyphomicrobiaceae bacterium]